MSRNVASVFEMSTVNLIVGCGFIQTIVMDECKKILGGSLLILSNGFDTLVISNNLFRKIGDIKKVTQNWF